MKQYLIPLGIIVSGFALAALLIATGPTLQARSNQPRAPLVRTLLAQPQQVQLSTFTHGTVVPRTESELVPEVSGRIIAISDSMVSGGFFSKGDVLLQVDTLDYEVALEQANAGLARATSDLSNARNNHRRQKNLADKQSISAAQIDDALNRLLIARATLKEAKAKLAKAQRDLDRTKITAPYDGRVRSERVDVGQFVNRGTTIATLYATDFAEVKLPIRDEELAFLDLSLSANQNDKVKRVSVTLSAKFAGQQHSWQGEVVRTEGELDPRTRMINVIAQVASPYAQADSKPPLSVGLFVRAEILGATVDHVVTIPRIALRGESLVYIVDESNHLRFRKVEVLRVAQDKVYIKGGLSQGDKVCISPLESALDGMTVKLYQANEKSQVVRS